MSPGSEGLLVAVVCQACALAIAAAGGLYWIRRRLDASARRDAILQRQLKAQEERDGRVLRALKRIGRKVGARMVLYDQSVFDEDDLSDSDRERLAEHLKQTRAGTPAETTELQQRAAPTPRTALAPLAPDPPTPEKKS